MPDHARNRAFLFRPGTLKVKRHDIVYTVYLHLQGRKARSLNDTSDKKSKKRSGKKDSQLILRMDKEERDEFVTLCKNMDTSAAREIRAFIRKFIKKNG